MPTAQITVCGVVATVPNRIRTTEGLSILSFRLAANSRRFDTRRGAWIDGDTNWFTVTAFRSLAENAGDSVRKGERVVVAGRLRVRRWESGERTGINVEIEADALGHDLQWGVSSFERRSRVRDDSEGAARGQVSESQSPAGEADEQGDGHAGADADDERPRASSAASPIEEAATPF